MYLPNLPTYQPMKFPTLSISKLKIAELIAAWQSVWPDKNRQMSIKVAQIGFH